MFRGNVAKVKADGRRRRGAPLDLDGIEVEAVQFSSKLGTDDVSCVSLKLTISGYLYDIHLPGLGHADLLGEMLQRTAKALKDTRLFRVSYRAEPDQDLSLSDILGMSSDLHSYESARTWIDEVMSLNVNQSAKYKFGLDGDSWTATRMR